MAKPKLTWQSGAAGRAGRWKKMIGGRFHYFDGGTGRSDREAYKKALAACDEIRAQLQTQEEKPHQAEYLEAIGQWVAVRDWCVQNDTDSDLTQEAQTKIDELNGRLARRRPGPLEPWDRFFDRYDHLRNAGNEMARFIDTMPPVDWNSPEWERFIRSGSERASQTQTPEQDGNVGASPRQWTVPGEHPLLAEELLWKDRIAAQLRTAPSEDQSIQAHARRFLDHQSVRVGLGKISAGRYDNLRRGLDSFCSACGSRHVEVIDEALLRQYYGTIQAAVANGEVSPSTGRDKMDSTDQFVRWLWKEGVIEALPRNLGDHELVVGAPVIEVFTVAEIKKLWQSAGESMRLHMLLALNCGMTQKDISDLHPSEVNWKTGTITRKRSKTRHLKSTPTVEYRLWLETLERLRRHRSNDPAHVLVNRFGNPLRTERILESGKLQKTDTVCREFWRLRNECEIAARSFGDLKKTSRSLLESNPNYQPIAELFVGRAPATISQRHYAQPPIDWLGEATDWLRTELGIDKLEKPKRGAKAPSGRTARKR
jgi:integrase